MWYLPPNYLPARSGICRNKPSVFPGTLQSPDSASCMEEGSRRLSSVGGDCGRYRVELGGHQTLNEELSFASSYTSLF